MSQSKDDGRAPSGQALVRASKNNEFAKQIADEIVRDAGSFGLGGAAIHAGAMMAAGRIWLRENPSAASAIEAATAGETTKIGSTEGESAVPDRADAQQQDSTP
jgi:hypothetical protein